MTIVGDAEFAADLLEVPHHDMARRRVERRDRFVGEDDLGLLRERSGDADALALAAGEVRSPARRPGRGSRRDASARAAIWMSASGYLPIRVRQVGTSWSRPISTLLSTVVRSTRLKPWKIMPTSAAQARGVPPVEVRDVVPVDVEVAARQRDEPVDRSDQRRLAGTGQPDDDDELTVARSRGRGPSWRTTPPA